MSVVPPNAASKADRFSRSSRAPPFPARSVAGLGAGDDSVDENSGGDADVRGPGGRRATAPSTMPS